MRTPEAVADVPFNDLRRRTPTVGERLARVGRRVIESGWYSLGPETETFESQFAAACQSEHCVAVGNGTDALEIALRAAGCGPGDEVIMTANAGMYSTTACVATGATPVFAEVDAATLLIDPSSVASLTGTRTRAVVATHLYGNVVDIEAVRGALPTDVTIVEDASQAHGATFHGRPVGALADLAAFSFYPTKNLGALGDAGAVVCQDADVAARARALRQYGWQQRYVAEIPGGRNSRIDELQAAFLCELLPDLPAANQQRRAIVARYHDELGARVAFVRVSPDLESAVAHLCVMRSERRDELVNALRCAGVATAVHYPVPDHQQPALARVAHRHEGLGETERACREVLSLPCFPELRPDEVGRVIQAVSECT